MYLGGEGDFVLKDEVSDTEGMLPQSHKITTFKRHGVYPLYQNVPARQKKRCMVPQASGTCAINNFIHNNQHPDLPLDLPIMQLK